MHVIHACCPLDPPGPCRSFYEQLEVLLDEGVLVGKGRACAGELRPLAFSMLAELIHHVRQDLKLTQLVRIIYVFARWVSTCRVAGRGRLAGLAENCRCFCLSCVVLGWKEGT